MTRGNPPLTGEELEDRAQRILAPDTAPAADAKPGDVLADLGPITDSDLYALEIWERDEAHGARRKLIADAVKKYGVGGELWRKYADRVVNPATAESRREYREKIMREQGRAVRPYGRERTPEEAKAEKAALAREQYAAKRGEAVRPYQKLADMTAEQKAAHRRQQAALRQARRRQAKAKR